MPVPVPPAPTSERRRPVGRLDLPGLSRELAQKPLSVQEEEPQGEGQASDTTAGHQVDVGVVEPRLWDRPFPSPSVSVDVETRITTPVVTGTLSGPPLSVVDTVERSSPPGPRTSYETPRQVYGSVGVFPGRI